jgi:hypothetical protein
VAGLEAHAAWQPFIIADVESLDLTGTKRLEAPRRRGLRHSQVVPTSATASSPARSKAVRWFDLTKVRLALKY